MIDAETAALLQQVFRREARSLLVYVGDASPWTSARDSGALVELRALVDAERQAINAIAEFLQRNRVPITSHGSYPASFTSINFLALKSILPRLVAFERESITALERDASHMTDPAAKAIVDNLLAVKRRNLVQFESMPISRSQPAA